VSMEDVTVTQEIDYHNPNERLAVDEARRLAEKKLPKPPYGKRWQQIDIGYGGRGRSMTLECKYTLVPCELSRERFKESNRRRWAVHGGHT
jgi:hypothetical protein